MKKARKSPSATSPANSDQRDRNRNQCVSVASINMASSLLHNQRHVTMCSSSVDTHSLRPAMSCCHEACSRSGWELIPKLVGNAEMVQPEADHVQDRDFHDSCVDLR